MASGRGVCLNLPRRNAAVQVFQVFYRKEQLAALDRAFLPFDNCGVQDERLELAVFQRLADLAAVRGLQHWGVVSWRFHEKTSLTGRQLLAAVDAEPGVDLFYMNPFPENEALYQSGWVQGAVSHPGMLELAQEVLLAAGQDPAEVTRFAPSGEFSAANYFVGNAEFWRSYLHFVQAVLDAADRSLAPKWQKLLHSTEADARGLHHGATFVPFVVERLLPVFLRGPGRELQVRKLLLPVKEKALNPHLRQLRSLKDMALSQQSPWLLRVWHQYRCLYLEQTTSAQWRARHAKALSLGFEGVVPP